VSPKELRWLVGERVLSQECHGGAIAHQQFRHEPQEPKVDAASDEPPFVHE
jgi:hypothetical protein